MNTDFCVQGLEHSKTYEITILAGIKGDPADERAPLDIPIKFVAKRIVIQSTNAASGSIKQYFRP